MLDWLKSILGDSYTDEIDQKIAAEIGKHSVSFDRSPPIKTYHPPYPLTAHKDIPSPLSVRLRKGVFGRL